uniref:EF-hand domain-containing protein n=1 Tax=Fagus sylvatica TaxID=28930 RepID=A0A2N9GC00_FAGSY
MHLPQLQKSCTRLQRRQNHRISDPPSPVAYTPNKRHKSKDKRPICLMEQKSSQSNGSRAFTCHWHFLPSDPLAPVSARATRASSFFLPRVDHRMEPRQPLLMSALVSRKHEEFLRLVKKEINLYNSVVENEGTDGEEEAKKAYKAASEDSDHAAETAVDHKVSSALIDRVDAMLHKLEKEIDDVDAKIGDRWRLLDRDYDGKVTPEEVASAAAYLKDTLDKEGYSGTYQQPVQG